MYIHQLSLAGVGGNASVPRIVLGRMEDQTSLLLLMLILGFRLFSVLLPCIC